jgi:hypothetical protein
MPTKVRFPASSWRRMASASPRFEWPTIPKTWVTPQATMVSTMASATVRSCGASSSTPTYTPSARTSTGTQAGASLNPAGGAPLSGS